MSQYLPILVLAALAIVFGALSRTASRLLGPSLPTQANPSAGMQYRQRRLHRSASDTRRSVATRPKV